MKTRAVYKLHLLRNKRRKRRIVWIGQRIYWKISGEEKVSSHSSGNVTTKAIRTKLIVTSPHLN